MSVHQDTRFYEGKYPEVDDVVMVQVKSIAEMGAYVQLLEYHGIEGMILLSELSRRRIRSITKLIKVRCALKMSIVHGFTRLQGPNCPESAPPLARRRHRHSLHGAPSQVGRQEPVMVLRVDKEKGYIDLSKR